MTPGRFTKTIEATLAGGVFPPIVGRVQDLRVGGALILAGEQCMGMVTLANTDPKDNRGVSLRGEVGTVVFRGYSAGSGLRWSTEFWVQAPVLRSLIDDTTYETLMGQVPGQPPFPENALRLNYFDTGVSPGSAPLVNGIALEEAAMCLSGGRCIQIH